jgi:hypothetical protein
MIDADPQGILSGTKVRDLPLLSKELLKNVIFSSRRGSRDYIVNMDSEDDGAGCRVAVVYTPLTGDMSEAPAGDSLMECLVPYAASLFHTVDTFHEFYYPVFLTRVLKARRLFHVGSFLLWEDPMQKGCLYIHLLEIPVKHGCKIENRSKGLKSGCGSGSLIIIHAILLCIPFGNIAYFVVDNLARVITLAFAYKFSLEGAFAMGDR